MALNDEVTFEYYHDTLGRSVVPTAEDFNAHKLENVLEMQSFIDDGLVCEKAKNGYINTVCLWIEEDYKAAQIAAGSTDAAIIASENIGGYSYGYDTKAQDLAIEKNTKSKAQNKYKWLSLFCVKFTARA